MELTSIEAFIMYALLPSFLVFGLWLTWKRAQEDEKNRLGLSAEAEKDRLRLLAKAEEIIRVHANTLYVKRTQLVKQDAYGNVFDDEWRKEKEYFYKFVIRRDTEGIRLNGLTVSTFYNMIDRVIDSFAENRQVHDFDIDNLNPYEFEAFCAQLLNNGGWFTQTTKGSGDQGVDIVGHKDGFKAVFQVKLHSSPVGNKAVQEILAGKAFESADLAFVVSNAKFTNSAMELANTTGVKLLHYSQLSYLPAPVPHS